MSVWDDGADPYHSNMVYVSNFNGAANPNIKGGYAQPIDQFYADANTKRLIEESKNPPKNVNTGVQPVNNGATSSTSDKGTTKKPTTKVAAPVVDPLLAPRNALLDYARANLSARGLNADSGVGKNVWDMFNTRVGGVTDKSGFTNDLFDNAYGTVKNIEKNKANSSLNSWLYDGFENDTFGSAMDDDILGSILGTQKSSVLTDLDTRKARGQINDAGYANALKELDNQFTSGMSRANSMGEGVLNKYRDEARTRGSSIRGGLDDFDLATGFNGDQAKSGFDSFVGTKKGSLDADIRAAIGTTEFFDKDGILGKAGSTGASGNIGGGSSAITGTPQGLSTGLTLSTPLDDKNTKNAGF